MKLIIAGSRGITLDPKSVYECLYYLHGYRYSLNNVEVVSGGAKGMDTSAELFSKEYNTSFKLFPADWEKHGKSAGYIRNKEMADYADALLLIWDGESKGSANMKDIMLKMNKPVYEVIIKQHNT